MWKRTALFMLVGILGVLPKLTIAAESDRIPLDVLFLKRNNDEVRSAAFVKFLTERFQRCVAVERDNFTPDLLPGIDVVVLDWASQEKRPKDYASPVGPLESWKKPTVLLGSTGLLIAGPWRVIGGAG